MLVLTGESEETLKMYEALWNKIRDITTSITNNSDNYHQKYMKIKFNSDDNLSLKRTLELHNMVIVVRSIFN